MLIGTIIYAATFGLFFGYAYLGRADGILLQAIFAFPLGALIVVPFTIFAVLPVYYSISCASRLLEFKYLVPISLFAGIALMAVICIATGWADRSAYNWTAFLCCGALACLGLNIYLRAHKIKET
jgi:hypothetical protein